MSLPACLITYRKALHLCFFRRICHGQFDEQFYGLLPQMPLFYYGSGSSGGETQLFRRLQVVHTIYFYSDTIHYWIWFTQLKNQTRQLAMCQSYYSTKREPVCMPESANYDTHLKYQLWHCHVIAWLRVWAKHKDTIG